MNKWITILMALLILVTSGCKASDNPSATKDDIKNDVVIEAENPITSTDTSEYTEYDTLIYDGQYVSITLDTIYHDHMEFSVLSKLQNNKCSVYLEAVALDGLVSPSTYSETSWIELNPKETVKSVINTELNFTNHQYLSAAFEVFSDSGEGVEPISIANFEIGNSNNKEYSEPDEMLAYDSSSLSVFYVGPDDKGIRLRASNKMGKTVNMVLDTPYIVNGKEIGEYSNSQPIPPYSTMDYYVNIREFDPDYSPDSIISFSCSGLTHDGTTIDEFIISSDKEIHPQTEMATAADTEHSVLEEENNIPAKEEQETSEVTNKANDYSNRQQINEYKQSQIEKYKKCYENAGIEYNVSANGCFVVGKDTERDILEKKYDILEFSCSVYDRFANTIKNGIELQYDVHPELGFEEDSKHAILFYQFYSLVEANPISFSDFVATINEALNEKKEDVQISGTNYRVYLKLSSLKTVPNSVRFVYCGSIPCSLPDDEDYKYIEFDSLDERDEYRDKIDDVIRENDINVKSTVHNYANENNLSRFDNNLGLAIKYYIYESFTNDIPEEKYREVLIKQLNEIGEEYFIDDDVTAEDIANEIITYSQINYFSKETKMYIDRDPSYRDFNTCGLREYYSFNPLHCRQYNCLLYSACGVIGDDFDTAHLYIPAKVQGLKNK